MAARLFVALTRSVSNFVSGVGCIPDLPGMTNREWVETKYHVTWPIPDTGSGSGSPGK
jgi:hypothetical protein